MFDDGALLGSIVSVVVPMAIAALIGMKFENFWLRIVTLLFCCLLSIVLYFVFAIAWANHHPGIDNGQSAFNAIIMGGGLIHIVVTLALSRFVIWELPKQYRRRLQYRKLQ